MTLIEILKKLEALGDEKVRTQSNRRSAAGKQFGVKLGDLRGLAKKIKTNHNLALSLWETGNLDAQLLATLLIKPEALSIDEMERLVCSVAFEPAADWLTSYVIKAHPEKETLRLKWMAVDHPMAARAGWSLTAERIGSNPNGLDVDALLDRIESEMGSAAPEVQWTMNFALAGIGIHFREHRERAIAIGESLGVYRDYPCSKGCTSPFAPIWIREMVRRQGS